MSKNVKDEAVTAAERNDRKTRQGYVVSDSVMIMETRPLSATKRWRVVEILEKAK